MEQDFDNNNENGKVYVVRVICQNKSLFIPFKEEELDVVEFPKKGMIQQQLSILKTSKSFNYVYYLIRISFLF